LFEAEVWGQKAKERENKIEERGNRKEDRG
jgi:hypothetical protein